MANDNVIGLAMGLDITDLKAGIKEVGKLVQQSRNEFNLASAGLDRWTKSSEGLTAKLNQLDKQLDAQKKAVNGYKSEIARVSQLEGDHSAQLEKLQAKLMRAEAEVKKTELSIQRYSDSLAEVTEENRRAESALGQLTSQIAKQKEEMADLEHEYKNAVLTYGKNSSEAKELKNQITTLTNELNRNETQLNQSERALEALTHEFEDAETGAEKLQRGLDGIKGIGANVTKVVAGIGAGIAGLATAFLATAEGTREFRTNMGKLETGFETAGLKAEQAAETYANLYAVVADEGKATEATAMLGQLAKTQEELTTWTQTLTGVYATFGDSLPIENLAEASLETANTGAITGGLADALNWAGVSEEKFQESLDECTSTQERQALITKTLNDIYAETADRYNEVNKGVIESNKAQVDLSATMAELGAKAEPIMTSLRNGFNEVLNVIIDLLNKADFEAIQNGIDGAFDYFIKEIIPSIKEGFLWIVENKDTLVAGIVAIGTAMLAWNVVSIIQGVVTAIKAWSVATQGMTIAQKALNLVMAANPIGLVVTAVAALVAGFITLWNTSDEFRAFWINLWDKIKSATSAVVTIIQKYFSDLWANIKKVWNGALTWFKNAATNIGNAFKNIPNNIKRFFQTAWSNAQKIWNTALTWFKKVSTNIGNAFKNIPNNIKKFFQTAWTNVKNAWKSVSSHFSKLASSVVNAFKNIPANIKKYFQNAWNNVKNVWSKVSSFFSGIIKNITNSFSNLSKQLKTIGGQLVSGLWNGIKDKTGWIVDKVKGFGNSVVKGIKSFFGIRSPSRLMAEMGGYLAEGLGQGLEDNTDEVIKPIENLGNEMVAKINGIKNQIERSRFKETMEGLGLQLENPFEGWTGAQLTTEVKKLEAEYKKLEEPLKNNLKQIQEQGESEALLVEQADLLSQRMQLQNDLVETLTWKLERHKQVGETDTTWATGKLEKYQGELQVTTSEAENLASQLEEIENTEINAENLVSDSRAGWQKWLDNVDDALGRTDEKMDKWSSGTGKYLNKIADMADSVIGGITDIGGAVLDVFNANIENQMTALDEELSAFEEQQEKRIKLAEETHKEELEKAQETYKSDLQALQEANEEGKLSDAEYIANKDLLESNLKEKETQLEEQLKQTKLNAENELQAKEQEIAAKKNELAKKQFNAQKANDIAMAVVNGAQAIVKGFAQLGPIGGAINAGVQAGITAAQIAVISKQKFVPMLAKGGIVDGATTAIIGEDGKEAVLPLEKNTGWMDELARKLSAIMQQDFAAGMVQPQVVPAYAGGNVINNTFNQTINSPHIPSRKEIYRDTKNLLTLRR